MLVEIIYNKEIQPNYCKMGLLWSPPSTIEAGQFLMLRVSEGIDPFLRRPFGIYRTISVDREAEKLTGVEILYKIVGKGTGLMAGLMPGHKVDILGPLGVGFPGFEGSGKLIMVAGGVGIVPFYILAERLANKDNNIQLLFGGRSKDDLPGLSDFENLETKIKISTENGEAGVRGTVTELLENEVSDNSTVYACGPKGMLKEVARITSKRGVPCFVSLDKIMACGMGACMGCAVKVSGKKSQNITHRLSTYKMVCKDGPIFDAGEIVWKEL
jgi:dihydroorotate dehydrogenase electron transfer subunit